MIELTKLERGRVRQMAKHMSIDGITRAIISRREFNLFHGMRAAVIEAVDEKGDEK